MSVPFGPANASVPWPGGAGPPCREAGGREALLDELYVRERNQGAGALLLEAAAVGSRAAGASRLFLETELANAAVRRFYARHGFAAEDAVWMQRPL